MRDESEEEDKVGERNEEAVDHEGQVHSSHGLESNRGGDIIESATDKVRLSCLV